VSDIAGALEASGLQGPSLNREVASAMINRRLNDMLALEQFLDDDRNIEGHHQLRIAAKRLRYTLEIFEPILGETTEAPLARVKRLQKILGDLHDCDVWIEFLPRFVEKERTRTRRFLGHTKGFKRIARGLEYLQEQRLRSRQDIFAALLEHWGECRRNGDWQVVRHLADPARASLAG
jgi:CHAD domain-containing protein